MTEQCRDAFRFCTLPMWISITGPSNAFRAPPPASSRAAWVRSMASYLRLLAKGMPNGGGWPGIAYRKGRRADKRSAIRRTVLWRETLRFPALPATCSRSQSFSVSFAATVPSFAPERCVG